MSQPCTISVAITGSLPRKADNPAVPITIVEQVESTHEGFEAGATLAHVHVHNDDQTLSSDAEKFGRLLDGLRQHCPGPIVQFSTGGKSNAELVQWVTALCSDSGRPVATVHQAREMLSLPSVA